MEQYKSFKREKFLREAFMEILGDKSLCNRLAHVATMSPEEYYEENLNMEIGLKIKNKRLELNLKQDYFAYTLGVTQSFLSKIERGKRPIPKKYLDKIKELYGIDF